MSYDFAQTFYVDKSVVLGSPQVNISAIDLYFKSKPKIGTTAEPNKSGIVEPGITVLFAGTHPDGKPNLSEVIELGRLEYNMIVASGDASSATRFRFPSEVYCDTNKMYTVIIRPDGFEDFEMWTNKKGSYFLGTNTISPGVTDKLIGNLYITQDRPTADNDPAIAGGPGGVAGTSSSISWIAKNDEDLTMAVYVARYATTAVGGNSVNSNTVLLPQASNEYILFDRKLSQREKKAHKGERIFQKNPVYNVNGVPKLISVQKNNTTITSTEVDFTAVYPNIANSYIVLVSESSDPGHDSGIYDTYNVRKVLSVEATNSIIVDTGPTFSNAVAKFIVSPVGEVDFLDKSKSFNGRYNSPSWYYSDRNKQDFLILQKSNANLSHRFVNNSIDSIALTANGGGYSNTDYIVISSATVGSANAYANIVTSASGGNIASVFLTTPGSGLIAKPTFAVKNSLGSSSTGTGANISFTEGPTLLSEIRKFRIKDVEVINFEMDAITPQLMLNNPSGTSYSVRHQLAYYKAADGTYTVNQNASSNKKLVKNLKKNNLPYNNTPVLVSRSNEVVLLSTQTGNSTAVEITTSSNSDFVDVCVDESVVLYHKNVINNDYTNEHTAYGNALAKHVSTKISFENGRLAEDVFVYLRAYRPTGTDMKVYSRLYNAADPEAYDDKDWTLLPCVSGATQFSSATNVNDLREYVYNLPQTPNSAFTSVGTVSMSSGCTVVTGVSTTFTSEVAGFKADDLVKVYNPLFPENHFITSVDSVTNSTSLVLSESTTNSSLLGAGLKIDKIKYPHQAYRNRQNDNCARYFNTSMHVFDGYDTFSIKIVLLSPNSATSPQIEDIRAVGVSA